MSHSIHIFYILSALLFVIGIKLMSKQAYARLGNGLSALGMLTAALTTLITFGAFSNLWIIAAIIAGGIIGSCWAHLVKMTAMPETVALLNGFGGLASLIVGSLVFFGAIQLFDFRFFVLGLTLIIGGLTFSGSLIAFAKLSGLLPGRAMGFARHAPINIVLLSLIITLYAALPFVSFSTFLFLSVMVLTLALGITAVLPIGGADMPIVIALLNSSSGLAASFAGFVLMNDMLIVGGALVGASGLVLTVIMCKAMNRSLLNVIVGSTSGKQMGKQTQKTLKKNFTPKETSAIDAFYALEAARSVVFVPGYGLAVAQAQHVIAELAELLEANGTEVFFAIHPVAGRMPGHMNVLLAEAGIAYEKFIEPNVANPQLSITDVCVVVGANDVVNPAARERKDTPIYGMPIIDADKARSIIIIKRSLAPGFSGVDNELYYMPHVNFLFDDAKAAIIKINQEFNS